MGLHIVHHPDYDARFSPVHRFPMGKYSILMEALTARGLIREGFLHVPGEAPPGWLNLAHDPAYVDQVIACQVPAAVEKDIGFPVDERVSRRARLAASGLIAPLSSGGIVGQATGAAIVYDAETTHGGSGGPVLNLRGEVVAVNAAIIPEFGGSNLGVPATRIAPLLEGLAPDG